MISSPFGSVADFDRLQLPADDARRQAVRLANPIRDEEPLMRSTLLPGLFRVAQRNAGRGFADLALFEIGHAFVTGSGGGVAPVLAVDHGPSVQEIARLNATIPDQVRLASAVLTGEFDSDGWWGDGRQSNLYDAIAAAHTVLRTSRVPYQVRASQRAPWHPGRCAEFVLTDSGIVVGHAGELHPRVINTFKLAPRTCAMELELQLIERAALELPPVQAPAISGYPVATQDVALVVAESVPAADVAAALVAGAAQAGLGPVTLLESARLFDVYVGEQLGAGNKSLAYALRFRAPDRTLTDEEVGVARDAAVAEAARRCGAKLRRA